MRSRLPLLAALAGASLVLAACTLATDLTVGQCFNGATDGDTVRSVQRVDCAEPHDKEVYAVFDFHASGDAFPGSEVLTAAAEERCIADFEPYVGKDFQSSELNVLYLTPSQETWAAGDREIACTLYAKTETEKLTGSMRGTGR